MAYDPESRPFAAAPSGGRPPSVLGAAVSLVSLLLLAGIFLVLLWRTFGVGDAPLHDPDAVPRLVAARGELAADEEATIAIFERASPAVVHINTARLERSGFLRGDRLVIPEGSGSGVIWDEGGHVVTNFHVIRTADAAEVRFQDHSALRARLVGVAPEYDLAVLKVDVPPGRRLHPIQVGSSADLRVGQKVFAIGNPFGLDQTLTAGIVSGLEREIRSQGVRPIRDVIQTDAAINPGNSGGPLLDSAGRLIGINTMIYTQSGAYAGVGFAVPVDTVNRVVPKLVRDGRIERAALGVLVAPDRLSKSFGVAGVVVSQVLEGSGAARAGLEGASLTERGDLVLGDVIVALDGEPVASRDDLFALLEGKEPGDVVAVRVRRAGANGGEVELPVRLQAVD
jgi:S1-C subfamily serine protease